ncbi:MAG: DUF2339 domain-containing protein, partial [Bacteroidota bacterium]
MDGLIVLLLIVFLIILIKLLNRTSSQKELLESLNKKVNYLNEQLSVLSKNIQSKQEPVKEIIEEVIKKTVVIESQPRPQESIKEIIPVSEEKIIIEQKQEPFFEEKIISDEKKENIPAARASLEQPVPEMTWWEKWVQNNPDIEKFIGENLANKIGIGILVLGISFFVKYAIDKDWINETGRVIIGLACGGLLTAIAHYFRNSYRSFSSVLAGGGIAVFYFTIAYAFHQYQLIGQQASFAIMVVITAFAVT